MSQPLVINCSSSRLRGAYRDASEVGLAIICCFSDLEDEGTGATV